MLVKQESATSVPSWSVRRRTVVSQQSWHIKPIIFAVNGREPLLPPHSLVLEESEVLQAVQCSGHRMLPDIFQVSGHVWHVGS